MEHPKVARADHDILELIRQRWSPRSFDPAREVARADLLRLFEAARWAPSSFNEQPWRFVVAERRETPEAFEALVESLSARNQMWARFAPVLVLVALRLTLERNDAANPHAWYDAGHAVALLTLQATALGLSVRQMEGFDRKRAQAAAAVPEPFEAAVIMAIGYAGDPDALVHDRHRELERQPRSRRPVGDFVFEGKWGTQFL
ncbi:MAG TPA: nitroreductase family protein [Gemmatimonadaceae bacterium]|nr:nitroreductase family protein [Gemmatimonadaceae bacterium]